jgi:hypothetical protein
MTAQAPPEFADLTGFGADMATGPISSVDPHFETHGTTVLCLRFDKGVLTLADRRATAGNLIMYDQAEKIVSLDDSTEDLATRIQALRVTDYNAIFAEIKDLSEGSF